MTAELANGRQVLLFVVATVVRDAPRAGLVSAVVGLAVAVTGGHIASRHPAPHSFIYLACRRRSRRRVSGVPPRNESRLTLS